MKLSSASGGETTEGKKQRTDGRRQTTEDRKQTTEDRKQTTEDLRINPNVEILPGFAFGYAEARTLNNPRFHGDRFQNTKIQNEIASSFDFAQDKFARNDREQMTENRQPTTDNGRQMIDDRRERMDE